MKKLAITCIALSTVAVASAQPIVVVRDPNQTKVNTHSPIDSTQLANDQLRKQKLTDIDKLNAERVTRHSAKALIEKPEILENLLLKAILAENIAVLPTLIKIYEYVPNRDKSLIEWGSAIIERKTDLTLSTKSYRELITKFPTNHFMRFQFAETLFFNREYEEAKEQFTLLRNTKGMTKADVATFDKYLSAIKHKEDWNISFGANFLNDKNLSNSAKEGTTMYIGNGSFSSGKRQSGQGIAAWLGLSRQWNLASGRFMQFDSNLSTKYYWNNKSYNEINAYAGLGFGYADAKKTFVVTPNIQNRFYAGGAGQSETIKRYSATYGVNLSFNYWINQNFKYSALYDLGYDKHQRYVHAARYDGASHQLTNAILYMPNAEQYWLLALDLSRKNTKDKSESYDRIGTRLTWGQDWPLGFVTASTLSAAKREYHAKGFFRILQENTEYSARVSVSNKHIEYAGFIPKLTWAYTKTDSNIPIYSYDKNQFLLEVGKSF